MLESQFKKGELVVVSIAEKGMSTSLPGDEAFSNEKMIWLFKGRYLIGEVIEVVFVTEDPGVTHEDKFFYFPEYYYKILTPDGILHVWESENNSTDLCIERLTPEKGDWLDAHCGWDSKLSCYILTSQKL